MPRTHVFERSRDQSGANFILSPGCSRVGGVAIGIEHPQRRSSDQLPSSGRVHRIDSGLTACNPNASAGDRRPRSRQPGRVQDLRQPTEIDEARRESEEVHKISWRRMQSNNLFHRNTGVLRDIGQIGTKLGVVTDRNGDDLAVLARPQSRSCRPVAQPSPLVRRGSIAVDRNQSAATRIPDADCGCADHAGPGTHETTQSPAHAARARSHFRRQPATTSRSPESSSWPSRTFLARIDDLRRREHLLLEMWPPRLFLPADGTPTSCSNWRRNDCPKIRRFMVECSGTSKPRSLQQSEDAPVLRSFCATSPRRPLRSRGGRDGFVAKAGASHDGVHRGLPVVFDVRQPAAAAEEPTNSAEVLTVDQAVQIALANNRNLKIVSLSLDSSKEKLAAEKTRRLPAFNTYVFGSQLLEPISFTVQAGQFGTYAGIGPIPATNTNITTPSQPTAYIFRHRFPAAAHALQDQHPHSRAGTVGRTGRPEGARGAHLDCR